MPKKLLPTLKGDEDTDGQFNTPKYKTVTIITINPVDANMWKYAEQETARFYELLKDSPESAFTHIFTNIKVEVKTIQIEV